MKCSMQFLFLALQLLVVVAVAMPTSVREVGMRCGEGYMCIDWSFGSDAMLTAAAAYAAETHFVVGSYGPSSNLGKCYEFTKDNSGWTFVGQAINEGDDVNVGQFDIQTGAGGFGKFNACTQGPSDCPSGDKAADGSCPSMFPADSFFGMQFGGVQTQAECTQAPAAVATLCDRAFAWDGRNGNINAIKRIACPQELVNITGLRLADDSNFSDPESSDDGYATTTMDCCKPSAGFPLNRDGSAKFDTDPSYPAVRLCRADGITRA